MNGSVTLPLGLFVLATAAALFGIERQRRWLTGVAKPAATLSLLALAWTPAPDSFGTLVCGGLFLSFLGDIVLLDEGRRAFMTGLVLFLFAHLLYAAAFVTGGGQGDAWWTPLLGVAIFGLASTQLLRRLWPGVEAGLRGPLMLYAAGITAMAASAYATLAGPWPPMIAAAAAVGAILFYLSDVNLAWNRFVGPAPGGRMVTLALYWTGQMGIAIAARWAQGAG